MADILYRYSIYVENLYAKRRGTEHRTLMFRSISQMKRENKKYLIVLLVASVLAAGGFLAWYLTGGFVKGRRTEN